MAVNRTQVISKIVELVNKLPSYEFSLEFRQEILRKFAQEMGVTVDFSNGKGKWSYLHSGILAYQNMNNKAMYPNGDKIGAIKFLRTEAEWKGVKLCLKYAKEYVEWVWGFQGTVEPKE